METIERRDLEIPALERLEPIHTKGLQRVFGALRLAMGWTFLWAFLDKAWQRVGYVKDRRYLYCSYHKRWEGPQGPAFRVRRRGGRRAVLLTRRESVGRLVA